MRKSCESSLSLSSFFSLCNSILLFCLSYSSLAFRPYSVRLLYPDGHDCHSRLIGTLKLIFRKAMIEEFDLDQDGAINEQEFLAIMLDGE